MDFQRQARYPPERLDNRRPHRKIRHEVPIHYVNMDAIRPGLLGLVDLLAQLGKISRKDGRGNFDDALVHIAIYVLDASKIL
jgi:hypothetical protein